jgi:hypothetical protein
MNLYDCDLPRFFLGMSLLAVIALAPLPSLAAEVGNAGDEKPMTQDALSQQCQELLRQRQKAAEDQNAENIELHERARMISQAPDEKKLALMSEFLTRLAEQKSDDAKRSEKMQRLIMAHLMKHMQMAAPTLPHCTMMSDPTDMRDLKNMNDAKAPNNQIAR